MQTFLPYEDFRESVLGSRMGSIRPGWAIPTFTELIVRRCCASTRRITPRIGSRIPIYRTSGRSDRSRGILGELGKREPRFAPNRGTITVISPAKPCKAVIRHSRPVLGD